LIKLQDAQIAQIRGGFINIVGLFAEEYRMFDKITRRADCANKRRIYKLIWDYLRKNIECLRKLQDAQIAQIRGGFINWAWYICGSGARVKNVMCVCLFLEKTEHIYYVDSFKLDFDIL
jgi:hypothetical protein